MLSSKARWRVLALAAAGSAVIGCATDNTPPAPQPAAQSPIYHTNKGSIVTVASWYGPGFDGHRTSSGSIYNQEDLTAASTIFPLGTRLLVTNPANQRWVAVVVNDHGPYVRGRELDLSHRAATMLGIVKPGTARVLIDILWTPPGGPPMGQRYFVQVGSYSNSSNAQQLRARLARYYSDAQVVKVESGDALFYRVRMGAFMDRGSARRCATTMAELGLRPLIVTE